MAPFPPFGFLQKVEHRKAGDRCDGNCGKLLTPKEVTFSCHRKDDNCEANFDLCQPCFLNPTIRQQAIQRYEPERFESDDSDVYGSSDDYSTDPHEDDDTEAPDMNQAMESQVDYEERQEVLRKCQNDEYGQQFPLFTRLNARPEVGDKVKVTLGDFRGDICYVRTDAKDSFPYQLQRSDPDNEEEEEEEEDIDIGRTGATWFKESQVLLISQRDEKKAQDKKDAKLRAQAEAALLLQQHIHDDEERERVMKEKMEALAKEQEESEKKKKEKEDSEGSLITEYDGETNDELFKIVQSSIYDRGGTESSIVVEFKQDTELFAGKILKKNSDQTYDVEFEDGEKKKGEKKSSASMIRRSVPKSSIMKNPDGGDESPGSEVSTFPAKGDAVLVAKNFKDTCCLKAGFAFSKKGYLNGEMPYFTVEILELTLRKGACEVKPVDTEDGNTKGKGFCGNPFSSPKGSADEAPPLPTTVDALEKLKKPVLSDQQKTVVESKGTIGVGVAKMRSTVKKALINEKLWTQEDYKKPVLNDQQKTVEESKGTIGKDLDHCENNRERPVRCSRFIEKKDAEGVPVAASVVGLEQPKSFGYYNNGRCAINANEKVGTSENNVDAVFFKRSEDADGNKKPKLEVAEFGKPREDGLVRACWRRLVRD